MTKTGLTAGLVFAAILACGQTQIDLNRQVRNALPYSAGGTNAGTQIEARRNVGSRMLIATDFAGSDIGQQVNNAFASFGSGRCGTVSIPQGDYTQTNTIYVPTGCILSGMGRGNEAGPFGTKLLYNGPPATAAIVIMKSDMSRADWASVRDLSVYTNAGICPNDGMLAWNAAAAGSNKWQCYDGSVYSTPVPHLAAVVHGQIDPTVLADGTHITISNVDVNGGGPFGGGPPGDDRSQGAFHFGVWLNGCEECVLQSVYVKNGDDGFSLGPSSNGVLLNQITARGNRRSGLHHRGGHAQCNECLFEANQWQFHTPDPTKWGAGIRLDGEDLGIAAAGLKSIHTYFEANWVDVFNDNALPAFDIEIDDFTTIRGKFGTGAKFTKCDIPDASLVTFDSNGGQINIGCRVLAGSFNIANTPLLVFTDEFGSMVTKVNRNDVSDTGGGRVNTYELVADAPGNSAFMYFRGSSDSQVRLDAKIPATASSNPRTPRLAFGSSKWTGASTGYRWLLGSEAGAPGGSPESTSGVYLSFNTTENRQFGFREGGLLQLTQMQAKLASPSATVQAAAGTGAACAMDSGNGVSNMAGQLTLTTGTAGWGAGAQCAITFDSTLNGWVTITPANAAAAAALNARQVYVDRASNQFVLSFGVADVAPMSYKFNWHAIGNY